MHVYLIKPHILRVTGQGHPSRSKFKVRMKVTRSILKNLVYSLRGQTFGPIILKFAQNVCVNDISIRLIMGRAGSKSRSLGKISESLV